MFTTLESQYQRALERTYFGWYDISVRGGVRMTPERIVELMFYVPQGSQQPRCLIRKDSKNFTWENVPEAPPEPTDDVYSLGKEEYERYHKARRLRAYHDYFFPVVPARTVRKALRLGLVENQDGKIVVSEAGRAYQARVLELRKDPFSTGGCRKGKGRLPYTNYRWRKLRKNRNPSGPFLRISHNTPCKLHKRERQPYIEVEEPSEPPRKESRRRGWKRYKQKETF